MNTSHGVPLNWPDIRQPINGRAQATAPHGGGEHVALGGDPTRRTGRAVYGGAWGDEPREAGTSQLSAGSLKVPSVDVRSSGRTLKGCRRADVEAAIRRDLLRRCDLWCSGSRRPGPPTREVTPMA